ncbi:hypothetical protein BX600DRAFT_511870 [Xylariales sp. PMI_506]|nr:hypothetical protein BX600DRAFT_511870 [Xylariales sp. PMI_506]
MEDYLTQNIPQVGLRVISFNDMSIVVFSWPHTLMDALSQNAFMEAITLTVQGRDDEVLTPAGGDFDYPLVEFGTHPTEEHKLANRRLGVLGFAGFGLGNPGEPRALRAGLVLCRAAGCSNGRSPGRH